VGVDAGRHQAESLAHVVLGPGLVAGHEARRLLVPGAGGEDLVDRGEEALVPERRRNAHEVRQVEMAEPADVDVRYGRDGIGVLDALRGLDQAHDQRALVRCLDLVCDRASLEVVMGEAEGGAAASDRGISGRGNDELGLLLGLDHRHHHAHRAGIQHARDVVVLRRRHAHHRDQPDAAAVGDLLADGLDRDRAVLHVVDDELGASGLADLRQARREELEDHRAVGEAALGDAGLDRIVAQRWVLSSKFPSR